VSFFDDLIVYVVDNLGVLYFNVVSIGISFLNTKFKISVIYFTLMLMVGDLPYFSATFEM
jgi:hypothetical protein